MSHKGIGRLQRVYNSAGPDEFGLFLGAGVNRPTETVPRPSFDTYLWEPLLIALYHENRTRMKKCIDRLWADHRDDWPGLAEELEQGAHREKLVRQIERLIYNRIPRGDKYGRLSKELLNQAPVLHAAICFSSRIKSRTRTSWTFERNPKIGVVLTPNYDFFFGAGWTRYEAFKEQWKVQTRLSKAAPGKGLRPVQYIHGYIPYKSGKPRDVILTRTQYRKYYAAGGFARTALTEAIDKKHLIFLGTGFTDPPINAQLRRAARQGGPQHFAVVRSDLAAAVRKLGVWPVQVEQYSQVSAVLEQVYCGALEPGSCRKTGVSSPRSYWKRLWLGKES